MPTPEEIKKIAREYAKEILSKQPMMANAIPEIWEKAVADTEKPLAELFEPLIAYLSKDYCFVPKKKIAEWQGIVEDAFKADQYINEPAWRFMWERLFGTALFNEEKEVNNA